MALLLSFKRVGAENRTLVHEWLALPHIAEWFYGDGLQSTLSHLDEFLNGKCLFDYWLAFDNGHPFAFLITSPVSKPEDELSCWCAAEGDAITLDMFIGDTAYLGKGLSGRLIKEFLVSKFSYADEVLIDPEATNARAIHVYGKAGFRKIGEFIPAHSPHPHVMMRLNMKELLEGK